MSDFRSKITKKGVQNFATLVLYLLVIIAFGGGLFKLLGEMVYHPYVVCLHQEITLLEKGLDNGSLYTIKGLWNKSAEALGGPLPRGHAPSDGTRVIVINSKTTGKTVAVIELEKGAETIGADNNRLRYIDRTAIGLPNKEPTCDRNY